MCQSINSCSLLYTCISAVQPPDICSEDTEYNYTALIWEKGVQWPRIAGPYYVNTSDCYNVLRIPVYGLKRDQEYSTTVVAYNNNTSLKSKKVYFCKLIVITSFLHTYWYTQTHTHTHTTHGHAHAHTHTIYIYIYQERIRTGDQCNSSRSPQSGRNY